MIYFTLSSDFYSHIVIWSDIIVDFPMFRIGNTGIFKQSVK